MIFFRILALLRKQHSVNHGCVYAWYLECSNIVGIIIIGVSDSD